MQYRTLYGSVSEESSYIFKNFCSRFIVNWLTDLVRSFTGGIVALLPWVLQSLFWLDTSKAELWFWRACSSLVIRLRLSNKCAAFQPFSINGGSMYGSCDTGICMQSSAKGKKHRCHAVNKWKNQYILPQGRSEWLYSFTLKPSERMHAQPWSKIQWLKVVLGDILCNMIQLKQWVLMWNLSISKRLFFCSKT